MRMLALDENLIFLFFIHDSLSNIDTSLFAIPTGEEHSRVQAHIDGDEFSAHILTEEAEYNVEVICLHMLLKFFIFKAFKIYCMFQYLLSSLALVAVYRVAP